MDPTKISLVVVAVFFPFAFAGAWIFATYFMARSGWRSFARRYSVSAGPRATVCHSPLTRFGSILTTYRNLVEVVFAPDGIHFSVSFLFSLFHAPFLLPWSSVRRIEKTSGIIVERYCLEIEDPAGRMKVWLPLTVEPLLLQHARALMAS